MIKIACCQYQIDKFKTWEDYAKKIASYISEAKTLQCDLIIFPEYAGIEIAFGFYPTEKALFEALQPLLPKFITLFQQLATQHHICILAGSIIERVGDKYVNRSYFFNSDGSYHYQDKIQLTESEKSTALLTGGKEQRIISASFGKIGIAICYDSEFPEIVRSLIKQGADIILVPSYTTTVAGFNRVLISCRARAIENQCYVAVSFMVNTVDVSVAADQTFGQSAILGPADLYFPDDGLIAQGKMNEVEMVTGTINLDMLKLVREQGQVHNYEDSFKNRNNL